MKVRIAVMEEGGGVVTISTDGDEWGEGVSLNLYHYEALALADRLYDAAEVARDKEEDEEDEVAYAATVEVE